MFLVRRITRAKWNAGQPELDAGEIPADAVTADLRTQGNSLSFWGCPADTEGGIREAALAIAAGRDQVAVLDIVWLDDAELRAAGHTLTSTEGRTPVSDLAGLHVDVSRLDYVRLGEIAGQVLTAIEDGRHRRLTRARVRGLIAGAVEQGRIDPDALQRGVREEVAA